MDHEEFFLDLDASDLECPNRIRVEPKLRQELVALGMNFARILIAGNFVLLTVDSNGLSNFSLTPFPSGGQ